MTVLGLLLAISCATFFSVALVNMLFWPKVGARQTGETGLVSVLIPARDEEARIEACLEAVCAQGPVVDEILVYDDHSTDGTADMVRRCAQHDGRVRLLNGAPLPEGWCGKPFACAQLAEAAGKPWMLFLDADALLAEGAADRIVAEAAARDATLLSCWPGLVCRSFWERMLMPMLNFCVFTLFPAPLSLLRPDPSMGLAHGACILARRDAYEAVGGHAAVRTEIFEDTRLARVWRERGQRGICLDGQHVVRVRMYERLGDIWRGFQKNFYPAFKRDPSFFLFLLFHFWCFLAPFLALPAAIAAGEPWRWFAVAAGCAFAARVVMGLRFGYPLWSSLLHPAAEAMFLALGVSSWLRCRSGRGIEWKGRRYRARAGETKP